MGEIIRPRKSDEPFIISDGEPVIEHEGRIGALVSFPVLADSGHGYVKKTFERFVRPPGTRIIACRDKAIYLQRERRLESANNYDWRLPGGKVLNTFKEYAPYIGKPIPFELIIEAGKRELSEEAHLEAGTIEFFKKSSCGAIVEWDLYYLVALNPKEIASAGAHDEAEEISDTKWFSYEQVEKMCLDGTIDEGRTVAVLMQFINSKK